MRKATEPAEPKDDQPKESPLLPAGRPLTPAHKALIAMLANIAVEQYLAEEDGK